MTARSDAVDGQYGWVLARLEQSARMLDADPDARPTPEFLLNGCAALLAEITRVSTDHSERLPLLRVPPFAGIRFRRRLASIGVAAVLFGLVAVPALAGPGAIVDTISRATTSVGRMIGIDAQSHFEKDGNNHSRGNAGSATTRSSSVVPSTPAWQQVVLDSSTPTVAVRALSTPYKAATKVAATPTGEPDRVISPTFEPTPGNGPAPASPTAPVAPTPTREGQTHVTPTGTPSPTVTRSDPGQDATPTRTATPSSTAQGTPSDDPDETATPTVSASPTARATPTDEPGGDDNGDGDAQDVSPTPTAPPAGTPTRRPQGPAPTPHGEDSDE